jgi:transcription elongation factor GreB
MSKAFVNEDAAVEPEVALPARPATPLPITQRGLDELRDELHTLDAASLRARTIAQALATVTVREPALQNGGVGFGCVVMVETEDGARVRYEIVGPDEAKPELGRISVTSPVARALMGQRAGAVVTVKKPRGDEELTIVDVTTK